MRKMGFSACSGFRQRRAPCLRAPEGSLDGFRCKRHNHLGREWGFCISIKGTFLSRTKGDIFIEGRQRSRTKMSNEDVPAAAERAGDFNGSSLPAPVDPNTGVAVPTRMVPASL